MRGGRDFSRTLRGSYIFEKNTTFNQYITVTDQDNKSTFYNVDVYSVLDLCSEGEIKVNKISSQNENELNIITHLCDIGKVDQVRDDIFTKPLGSQIEIDNEYVDDLSTKKQRISLMTYNFPYGPTIQGSLKTPTGIEIINEVTDLSSITSDAKAKIVFTLPMSTPVEFSSRKLLLSSREVGYTEDGTDKTGLLVNKINYVTNATDSTLELATKFDAGIEDNQEYPRIKFNYSIEKDSNNEIKQINKSLLLGLVDYVEGDGHFLEEPYIQFRYTNNEYGIARLLQLHSSLLLITSPEDIGGAVYAPQHTIQAKCFVGNIGYDDPDPDFAKTTVLNTLHVNKDLEVDGTINGLIPVPTSINTPPVGSIFMAMFNFTENTCVVSVGDEIIVDRTNGHVIKGDMEYLYICEFQVGDDEGTYNPARYVMVDKLDGDYQGYPVPVGTYRALSSFHRTLHSYGDTQTGLVLLMRIS